ncbi:MAG: UDP-4-amino-4,6-dideoxy-N-acetyl-beta-L-altrosamine N-acetyltransferase [Methylocystaceae bacterium]|nr:UDP-4-amino-4,6-dideoxy-N-acetyl-beta-L-altrosamine N-acetyltransferase [Methylocystaceae bacterium]
MTEDDLTMLLAWRNHPDVRRFMFTQHEIGLAEHRNWFAKASIDTSRRLLIVEEAKHAIGYVQFSQVTEGGISEWGFYARPDSPKGTGRILGAMALTHAFGHLKLHKVCGQAITGNEASIAFHQRLGFTLEGVLRDHKRIDGAYYNLHCFGLLASEWPPEKLI